MCKHVIILHYTVSVTYVSVKNRKYMILKGLNNTDKFTSHLSKTNSSQFAQQ